MIAHLLALRPPTDKSELNDRLQQAIDATSDTGHKQMLTHLKERTLAVDCVGQASCSERTKVGKLWAFTLRVMQGEFNTRNDFSQALTKNYLRRYGKQKTPAVRHAHMLTERPSVNTL